VPATAASSAATDPGAPDEAVIDYIVQPRDTLIGLGRDLFNDPSAWPEVAALSGLRNPDRIFPGQHLKVPERLLRWTAVPARLAHVEGQVTVDNLPAAAGQAVQPGQTVATAADSSAVVLLDDGSRIRMSPDTALRIDQHRRYALHGSTADSASLQREEEGTFAATMRLIRGGIEVLASKVLRAKPLDVQTPTAVVGVRGTEYRVRDGGVAPGTRTEVLDGVVAAGTATAATTAERGIGGEVSVSAGQGVAIRQGLPLRVVPLQPAPDLSAVPQRFERPVVRFPATGALPLRVQVARDAAQQQLVADEVVQPGQDVRIGGLPDGTWYLRARSIGDQGIEGLNADRSFVLKARPEPPAASLPRRDAKVPAGPVEFAWAQNTEAASYRLQVARDADFGDAPVRDGIATAQITLPLTEPGTYAWRMASVRSDGDVGPWGDPVRFEIKALPEPPRGGTSADGRSIELSWSGRPEDRQHVQLATDAAFTSIVSEAELDAAHWTLPRPRYPGTYYFRYQSLEPDGYVSPWSSTLKFDVQRDNRDLLIFVPALLLLLL